MIFINNFKKKIGNDGLIINLKANNFYEKQNLRPEDVHKLYDIFTKFDSKINLSPPIKKNFFLCVLYYESNYNENAKNSLNEIDIKNYINENWTNEEKLFIIFNLIEIEIKTRKKTEKELESIYHELLDVYFDQNKSDILIIKKHYLAYLQYFLGDYNSAEKYIEEIINYIDRNTKFENINLINYLNIRNHILKIKILESKDPNKNYNEILSYLDTLLAKMKDKKEDFAICIGIKMLSLQAKQISSFEECIKLVQEMLDILKRETLFGKSHQNILEQYLYLTGLLGYFNSINDDSEGVLKASKKIDNYLSDVNEITKENKNNKQIKDSKKDDNNYKDLYTQYSYYNSMLKSSINFNNEYALKESQNNIKKIQNKIDKSEIDDLNICILERDEINISQNMKKYEDLFLEHSNEKLDLNNNDLFIVYFYLYNKISSLMNNLVSKIDIDKIKSKKDVEEIKNLVNKIIDTTKKQVLDYKNINIKKLFSLPIFKNLFNRFYYVKMYIYYLEGRYKDCLSDYKEYDEISKNKFSLETAKSKGYMKKLEADCYFKLKDYEKAEKLYDIIIAIGTKDPLIYFNLGLSAYLNKKTQKALEKLEQCANMYKTENKNKNAKTVEELIDKIKSDNQ